MKRLKPMKTRPQLMRLVEEFMELADLQTQPLGETPQEAYDRCHEVSISLSWYAGGRGFASYPLHSFGPIRLPKTYRGPRSHWVVWFPGVELGVDLTARQFWPEMEYPKIWTWVELEKFFGEVAWPAVGREKMLEVLCRS